MDPEISGSEHVHPKKNEGSDNVGVVGMLYEHKWKIPEICTEQVGGSAESGISRNLTLSSYVQGDVAVSNYRGLEHCQRHGFRRTN